MPERHRTWNGPIYDFFTIINICFNWYHLNGSGCIGVWRRENNCSEIPPNIKNSMYLLWPKSVQIDLIFEPLTLKIWKLASIQMWAVKWWNFYEKCVLSPLLLVTNSIICITLTDRSIPSYEWHLELISKQYKLTTTLALIAYNGIVCVKTFN